MLSNVQGKTGFFKPFPWLAPLKPRPLLFSHFAVLELETDII